MTNFSRKELGNLAQLAVKTAENIKQAAKTSPIQELHDPSGQAMKFTISEFQGHQDNKPKAVCFTWPEFCHAFNKHIIRAEKNGPAWSPASFAPNGLRKNEHVEAIAFAVIDVDNGVPVEELQDKAKKYACLIHSSHSHTLEKPKYRVIIPFAKPVSKTEWPEVWARINLLVGQSNDPATKDPSRLYYKPACPNLNSGQFVHVMPGVPISIDDLPLLPTATVTQPLVFHPQRTKKYATAIEGIESTGDDLNFEQGLSAVVGRCKFMSCVSAPENQPTVSEPLWMAMVSNAARFENSDAWIHNASEHHPEYDEAATEKKIVHVREGSAPITCQRIRDLGFKECPIGGCMKPNGEIAKAPAALYGWMFQRQLTATETENGQMPKEYHVGNFKINDSGVYKNIYKEGELVNTIKICSRIDVVGLTRDQTSGNWGMELRFKDPDNVMKTWAVPMEYLASSGDAFRAPLLKMGAILETSLAARSGLAEYFTACAPEARALSITQPGWSNGTFVLPDKVYGRADERVVFQTKDPEDMNRFSQKGTLESWKQNIALPCKGNSRAILSICIGLAPPLLRLLGEDNGGFHLRGNSSIGKSVCLYLGSSVWGGDALIRTWNLTINGMEGIAAMHNDILLPLDELGQADPKAAGEAAYMLGNGQGKTRATRDGESKAPKRFRNIVLSSGEKSISDLMTSIGSSAMAGHEVRMVEIPADAGCNFGVFEDIHDARSSQEFAEALKHNVTQHHGFAGRAFLEALTDVELQPKLVAKLKTLIQGFIDNYVPTGSTGQVGRVARRFGLVAAAGEVCIELGILPWAEGEALEACKKCFMSWIELRGGVGNQEEAKALAQVRRFIELHGDSRFTALTQALENDADSKTINRAGFRRLTENDGYEYFILPEVYKTEICSGLSPTFVTKTLVEKGYLNVDKQGRPQIGKRFGELGKFRVYHLKATFLSGSVSQPEKDETPVRQAKVTSSAAKYSV